MRKMILMPKKKLEKVRELDQDEVLEMIYEKEIDLSNLRSSVERGSVKKESGRIKPLKKEIARLYTVLNEKDEDE